MDSVAVPLRARPPGESRGRTFTTGCDGAVQHAFGHSSPTITLDTYSHLWPKAEDRTRNAAAGLMSAVFADESADSADSVRTSDAN